MKKHVFYFLVLMCSSNLFAMDTPNSALDIHSIDQKALLEGLLKLYSRHLNDRMFHTFDANEDALSESKNLFIMLVARTCKKGKSRNINISVCLTEKLTRKKILIRFHESIRKINEPEAMNIAKSLEDALGPKKSKNKKSGLSSEKSSLLINSNEILAPQILAEKITLLTYKYSPKP